MTSFFLQNVFPCVKMEKIYERRLTMSIFSITDFGAVTSDRLQTKSIQNAIDACFLAGGGRVVVPCGIFITGGIRLRSNVELYLESGAILRGSDNPDDYNDFWNDTIEPVKDEYKEGVSLSAIATSSWCNGLIRVLDAENVKITGEKGSYIDGRNVYNPEGEEKYRGPHAICVWRCKGLTLSGYTIIDSANWAHAIFQSSDIMMQNVSVYGGHDGFDVRTCDNVLVENCILHTGDDCVAGFDNHDVTVRNCDMQTACSVFRFGGNHVLIENCRSSPARFGFRGSIPKDQRQFSPLPAESARHIAHTSFLYYCDFRAEIRKTPGDITVKNCTFDGTRQLFRLEFDGEHKWCCNRSLSSIAFENCEFLNLDKEGVLHGDAKEKVSYSLKNCRITKKGDVEDFPLLICTNFDKVSFENVTVEGFEKPFMQQITEGEFDLQASTPIEIRK